MRLANLKFRQNLVFIGDKLYWYIAMLICDCGAEQNQHVVYVCMLCQLSAWNKYEDCTSVRRHRSMSLYIIDQIMSSNMPDICLISVWDLSEIYQVFAWWNMPELCLKNTSWNIRYVWDMLEIWLRYNLRLSKISLIFAWYESDIII